MIPTAVPSTTCGPWRIRPADGRPGMRSARALNRGLICTRHFRKGFGVHRYGCISYLMWVCLAASVAKHKKVVLTIKHANIALKSLPLLVNRNVVSTPRLDRF